MKRNGPPESLVALIGALGPLLPDGKFMESYPKVDDKPAFWTIIERAAALHPLPMKNKEREFYCSPSMPEMPLPGQHHCQPEPVGGGDHLGIADGAAGLDDCSRARNCNRL